MGTISLLLIFAVTLLSGPIVAAALNQPLGAMASAVLVIFGGALLLVSTALLVVTRLYVKTKASESFVRTGMGGMRVIKDGGALIIPVVHQIVRISLQTLRLEVSR